MYLLHIFQSKEELTGGIAEYAATFINSAITHRDQAIVALSGGSTPRPLYKLLAQSYRNKVHWEKVKIFWGDERCVPPDHNDSNYLMVKQALLDHVPIPASNIYRVKGELDPHSASDDYRAQLQSAFGTDLPRFDLMLLGMGDDGHTASLFPNTDVLHEQSKWVVPSYAEALDSWRITLTYPVINNARNVVFLVSGENKARMVNLVLNGPEDVERYPSQGVKPTDGELYWFVDEAAASRLKPIV